ncbi:MAG: cytochrome c family protein [Candidatus Zixiibacteriota bacterium]
MERLKNNVKFAGHISLGVIFAGAISLMSLNEPRAGGEEKAEHNFIGAKKCKMCHVKEKDGAQYKIWSKTAHARAFDTLGSDKAKATAKELGIEDPQASGKCLKCHSTAYFFTEELVENIDTKKDGTPRLAVAEGVSCESCHNAGSGYKKKKTMKDRDLSIAGGLNPEPEKRCVKCHNDENPNWDPKKYTLEDGTTAGFDFDQAWDKIKHYRPKKDSAAAGK